MTVPNSVPKAAKRDSWKALPMPESRSRLPFTGAFTQEEFDRVSLGHLSRDMDDKWFIFLEGNDLYFHRSWTGICIYQVRFEKQGDTYIVVEAWVNRDESQYSMKDDNYDTALLPYLIDTLLLGKETPFPLPSSLPKGVSKEVYHHTVVGTGRPFGK